MYYTIIQRRNGGEKERETEFGFNKAMLGIDPQALNGEFAPAYSLYFLFAFLDSLLKSGRFCKKKFLDPDCFLDTMVKSKSI